VAGTGATTIGVTEVLWKVIKEGAIAGPRRQTPHLRLQLPNMPLVSNVSILPWIK